MTIEVRHLRCFLAVAAERNVTRAATAVHLSQPALSRTLMQLESLLGTTLVERSTHHLELTDAGRAFVVPARAAVRAFDAAVASVAAALAPLRLGLSWSTTAHSATIARAWRAANPDRPIRLHRRDDHLAGLTSGDVDVALVRGPIAVGGVRSTLLEEEPRLAVLPRTHPLSGAASLRLAELAREALVVNTVAGTTTLDLWPARRRPTIGAEVLTMDDWIVSVASGVGVGVTAASTATLHPHPDLVYVPILDAPPIPLVLAWPARGAHRDVRRLVAVASDAIARRPG